MGDTELSYYLPSRQTGVNDMYLHLGFTAQERFVRRSRVRAVWAVLRLRHPLLSAHVEMHDYNDVRFIYTAPSSSRDLLVGAEQNLEYRTQSKDELIDSYLNGPRTLSNTRLSYLVVSEPAGSNTAIPTPPRTPSPSRPSTEAEAEAINSSESTTEPDHHYELLICAMHFLGDGMALHQFANDFFGMLGSDKNDADFEAMLETEWRERWQDIGADAAVLPKSLEEHMPLSAGRFRRAAAQIDFQLSQEKLVGGHVFPRRKHPERRTIVPTVSFPEDRTKAILKKCKANGVSISAALFAICNVAWARVGGGPKNLPVLMYSALNLRPYFTVKPSSPWNSYWFLAIGYFNVVLPSFLPSDDKVESTFWHRARQAKDQSTRAAKSPLVASRTHEMAQERGGRARGWAKEDDEKELGVWKPPVPSFATETPRERALPARSKAPSAALLGLSLLGNLDGMYKHASFPSIHLHTLTTGSRQRHGAMLLFGYTFAGKLWISLGYDCNGFPEGFVDAYWRESLAAVDEFLG
ncbi:hypothetical protein OBBRIDRAFT_810282 [Obba rivulosa]|uniref:Uncharacterized protein n=1 Tax=Obba rivulosa TaxID=1052685 RepID=A0A8E2DRS4_9APHY|nr:hypothetical protein OBBRIDRAFT_810282 [Obba rivulosa]